MFPSITEELVRRYDIPAPRYTSYPTAPVWTEKVGPAAYAEALGRADAVDAPLSLYCHIPFCKERCSFCGCNVVISRRASRADTYLDAVEQEIKTVAALLPHRRSLSQIHWGGGTPTFLSEDQITRLWNAITAQFKVLPTAEVSVEVNPEVTSESQLALLRRLGFNRLSMGVQDVDPNVQAAIRRHQPIEVTRDLLAAARRLGFSGINFDLIYGLPEQTVESWGHTLRQVLELRPDRVAVYGFALLPDMKPHQRRLLNFAIPRGADKLELFRLAYEAFTGAGYRQIGMDHFALPEDELSRAQAKRSLTRNFQGYTVQAATEVVAFGVTGISDIGGVFAQNQHLVTEYEKTAGEGKLCAARGFRLTAEDKLRRDVINQLMCNFYVDLGKEGLVHFAPELEKLKAQVAEGLLTIKGSELELTDLGRVFVRNVVTVFDEYLGNTSARFSRAV